MAVKSIKRVSQITDRRRLVWDLQVFVIRVWMEHFDHHEPRICLILSDESGDRIEAVVQGDDCKIFKYVTKSEGKWFRIRDTRVKVNQNYASNAHHPFRLEFEKNTTFFRIYDYTPDVNLMNYPSFSDIIFGDHYPKDCVGVVTRVGKIEFNWRGPKVQFTLRDLELRSIQCIYIGKEVWQLVQRFRADADKHLFVILRCFFIERRLGCTWLSSRSTIMYDQFENESWTDFANRFPNPVPLEYPQEDLLSWIIT